MVKTQCYFYCPKCNKQCTKDIKHKGPHFCENHGKYSFNLDGVVWHD